MTEHNLNECPECGGGLIEHVGVVVRQCPDCELAWHRDSYELRPMGELEDV